MGGLSPLTVIGVPACTALGALPENPFIFVKISPPEAQASHGRSALEDQRRPGIRRTDVAAESGEKFAADPVFVGGQVSHDGGPGLKIRD